MLLSFSRQGRPCGYSSSRESRPSLAQSTLPYLFPPIYHSDRAHDRLGVSWFLRETSRLCIASLFLSFSFILHPFFFPLFSIQQEKNDKHIPQLFNEYMNTCATNASLYTNNQGQRHTTYTRSLREQRNVKGRARVHARTYTRISTDNGARPAFFRSYNFLDKRAG